MRKTAFCAGLLAVLSIGAAQAQVSDDVIKIGVLNDQSGSFADLSGPRGVLAAQMAAEDFGGTVLGKKIEIVSADHQNKVDIGLDIARKWFENEGVDIIIDVPNSAIALGVQDLARDKNKIAVFTSAGSSALTGDKCSPNGIHWTYDTYALARGVATAMLEEGDKDWFFLVSDYAFGHALRADAGQVVEKNGGRIVGEVKHPLNTSDFASYLLQAQASKAQVIGLANGSADTVNSIKQANEFGIVQSGQKLAALLFFITDTHSLGLELAQGVNLVEAFYWDQNDETRAWSKRFEERTGVMPSMLHASNYGVVMHYLKAVQAAGTDETGTVLAKMKSNKINDFFTKDAYIREDGRVIRDMYLYRVKAPSESKRAWDYYHVVRTIPGEQAFRPLSESTCPLVKK